jgi:hypothetical protein
MKPHKTTDKQDSNEELTIADNLYALCKSMTFPLLMSFNELIHLDLEELVDIIEVFSNENSTTGGTHTIYENGEKITVIEGARR